MTATMVTCRSCGATNRIPPGRAIHEGRCGRCKVSLGSVGQSTRTEGGDQRIGISPDPGRGEPDPTTRLRSVGDSLFKFFLVNKRDGNLFEAPIAKIEPKFSPRILEITELAGFLMALTTSLSHLRIEQDLCDLICSACLESWGRARSADKAWDNDDRQVISIYQELSLVHPSPGVSFDINELVSMAGTILVSKVVDPETGRKDSWGYLQTSDEVGLRYSKLIQPLVHHLEAMQV